jgi:hypothetical protein
LKKALENVSTALLQKKMKVFLSTQLLDSAKSLLMAATKSLRMAELYWNSRILAMQQAAACLISVFPHLMYSKRLAR